MQIDISTVTMETEYDEPYAVKLFLENSHYNKNKTEGMTSFEELAEFITSQNRFSKLIFGNNDQLIIDNLWEMNFKTEKFAELVGHRDRIVEIQLSKESDESFIAGVQYFEENGCASVLRFPVVFRIENVPVKAKLLLTNLYPTPSVTPIMDVFVDKETYREMIAEGKSMKVVIR